MADSTKFSSSGCPSLPVVVPPPSGGLRIGQLLLILAGSIIAAALACGVIACIFWLLRTVYRWCWADFSSDFEIALSQFFSSRVLKVEPSRFDMDATAVAFGSMGRSFGNGALRTMLLAGTIGTFPGMARVLCGLIIATVFFYDINLGLLIPDLLRWGIARIMTPFTVAFMDWTPRIVLQGVFALLLVVPCLILVLSVSSFFLAVCLISYVATYCHVPVGFTVPVATVFSAYLAFGVGCGGGKRE
jgi:hypothetical protein